MWAICMEFKEVSPPMITRIYFADTLVIEGFSFSQEQEIHSGPTGSPGIKVLSQIL